MNEEITLILDENVRVTCERDLLCKSSPYFNAMFSESFVEAGKQEVRLHGINKDAMETLISFARTQASKDLDDYRVDVNSENAINLLQASGMLHFESVRQMCCEYLLREVMSLSNVLQVLGIIDEYCVIFI